MTAVVGKPALALVTGGRSGIGRAVALKIATFPFVDRVLAISRAVKDVDFNGNSKVIAFPADITTDQGRKLIVDEVAKLCGGSGMQLRYLIHCAAVIEPIKRVLDVQPHELRYAMNVNCESPLFLTTSLYKYMARRGDDGVAGRVLHVSTGAAHGAPPVGWSIYGITKAAFFQSYKALEREFREAGSNVLVGSFKPGVVDTDMQSTIRETTPVCMPAVQNFINMKATAFAGDKTKPHPPPRGGLDTAENVACFAQWLLLHTSDDEFAKRDDPNEWDIRDESLYPKWVVHGEQGLM